MSGGEIDTTPEMPSPTAALALDERRLADRGTLVVPDPYALGEAAYETARAVFDTGDLSWADLGDPQEAKARVRERWVEVALAVVARLQRGAP